MNINYNLPDYTPVVDKSGLYTAYEGFIRGNMFNGLYDGYKNDKNIDITVNNSKEEMFAYLYMYEFALIDLSLYLDLHPEDRNTIELYSKYLSEYKRVLDECERNYGPITLYSYENTNYPWNWIESWPWEN